tara:strand:- start:9 stop:794 length:786 start_codon:yes stop_codon:yes gene_type:complete
MQNYENIERISYEAVEDLRKDNVENAEIRFAPLQHLNKETSPKEIVKAAWRGLSEGEKDFGGNFNLILCGMRQNNDSFDVAKLAIETIDYKVVGFDLAGPEFNYPPSMHLEACHLIHRSEVGLTIHAGEAANLSYIEDAILNCKAQRIGHGWQIIEGCKKDGNLFIPNSKIAELILERQIPLEICISSNVKSGASEVSIDNHPAISLLKSGFKVTLNTDNRLMANTTLSKEFEKAKQFLKLESLDKEILLKNSHDSLFTNL